MCVYEDTFTVWQIWGCPLDIWGTMCSQSSDSFDWVKNFSFELMCVCGDDDFN